MFGYRSFCTRVLAAGYAAFWWYYFTLTHVIKEFVIGACQTRALILGLYYWSEYHSELEALEAYSVWSRNEQKQYHHRAVLYHPTVRSGDQFFV